jgi:hypothetical protein
MAQSTSVNGNASLTLIREDLPSGAITIMVRVKVASWSGGNASQTILRVEGSSGQLIVYADRAAGNIVCSAGSFTNISTGSYAGWGTLSLVWDGTASGTSTTVRWTPDGGSTTSAVVGSRGDLWALQLLGLYWDATSVCNQVYMCSALVDNRAYSDAEVTAQSLSDTNLEAVNAFYPMSAHGTAGTSTSGSGGNLTHNGTGTTVSDSPYPQAHDLTAVDLSPGAIELDGSAIGQAHALTGTGLDSGTPTLGSAALAQVHALAADGLSSGTPEPGTTALGVTVHELGASGLTSGTPLLGSAALNAPTGNTRLLPPEVDAPQLTCTVSAPQLSVSVT